MVTQAPVKGCEPEPSAAEGVSRNIGDFVGDVMSLGEMQVQLFALDLQEACQKAVAPALGAAAAILVASGSIPILLMAVAWCLVTRAGLPQDVAFLVTFAGAAILAGAAGWFCWLRLSTVAPIVIRSAGELSQNMRWIKHALQKRRRMPTEKEKTFY